MSAQELAAAVIARRTELGLGQEAAVLAAGSGISTSNWSKIENGKEGPYRPSTFAAIDRALGWTVGTAQAIAGGSTPVAVKPDVMAVLTKHEDRIAHLEAVVAGMTTRLLALAERSMLPDADDVPSPAESRTAR